MTLELKQLSYNELRKSISQKKKGGDKSNSKHYK